MSDTLDSTALLKDMGRYTAAPFGDAVTFLHRFVVRVLPLIYLSLFLLGVVLVLKVFGAPSSVAVVTAVIAFVCMFSAPFVALASGGPNGLDEFTNRCARSIALWATHRGIYEPELRVLGTDFVGLQVSGIAYRVAYAAFAECYQYLPAHLSEEVYRSDGTAKRRITNRQLCNLKTPSLDVCSLKASRILYDSSGTQIEQATSPQQPHLPLWEGSSFTCIPLLPRRTRYSIYRNRISARVGYIFPTLRDMKFSAISVKVVPRSTLFGTSDVCFSVGHGEDACIVFENIREADYVRSLITDLSSE